MGANEKTEKAQRKRIGNFRGGARWTIEAIVGGQRRARCEKKLGQLSSVNWEHIVTSFNIVKQETM